MWIASRRLTYRNLTTKTGNFRDDEFYVISTCEMQQQPFLSLYILFASYSNRKQRVARVYKN